MEPRPIEPQDIRVGMRVRVAWTKYDAEVTAEFTVGGNDPSREQIVTAGDGPLQRFGWTPGTWTLLADAPKPARPVGSRWRDPETGAEYVRTALTAPSSWHYIRYTRPNGRVGSGLIPDYDAATIARLTPIDAFDPAALWPHETNGRQCGADTGRWLCCRADGHDGLHAAYVSSTAGTQPVYCWGDPR